MGEVSTPQISVIMAAYNVERFIDEAIQSVLAQKGVSFELLIGDDASTDGTRERVAAYLKDPRIRARRFRYHRGVAFNWNQLLSRSRGEWVALCDPDDVMLPGHLVRSASVCGRGSRAGVVYSDLRVLDEMGNRSFIRHHKGPSRAWDLLWDYVWHPGTLMRRVLLLAAGGYDPRLPCALDADLFLRLAERTTFRHVAGRPLFLYRKRAGSLTDRSESFKKDVARQILRKTIARRYGYRVPW